MKKKQAITILASIETYENLVSFQNLKELNDTVRAYKEQFADRLNKNQLAVLNHLHTHSCKYFGVSFKSKKKIAEVLHISRRTVIRACQHLESLGIIKQLEMKRKSDMRQTSNIIVIQPIFTKDEFVTEAPTKTVETIINGNAEITPSRIACRCLCSESLAIGPDKFLSRNVTNLFITLPPN